MIKDIIRRLKTRYPDAACSLDYESPLQLLIAVILSAQSTDKMVNSITPALFKRYRTARDFAEADLDELEGYIRSSGFYRNKARNIKECCRQLVESHGGKVPPSMEDLVKLAGVGRKTANVVLLNAFGIAEGIAVDTHVGRVSNRIGLSTESDPLKVEKGLLSIVPKENIGDINHLFIAHGREICTSRRPKCGLCPVAMYCNYAKNARNITT